MRTDINQTHIRVLKQEEGTYCFWECLRCKTPVEEPTAYLRRSVFRRIGRFFLRFS